MLKLKHLFFLMLMVTNLSCQNTKDNRGYIVEVGDKAPLFETTLTNGDTFRLEDHKGKVVMLQFTASWCGVCRKEMPHIEKEIWQPYKDKGLVVVGIDRDEPLETVRKFAKETGISYPLALDPGADIFKLYAEDRAGVTRNVLIDKEGNIIFLTRLFNEKEFSALVNKVDQLMKN
ncbi:TlpA disulfide reductase family protein [Marinilabilia sp.]|uniref:TlpA family protein disulfide reductase n=1 Tax=Marinilabilia sp. TaxID=2021252 RepID=UPI0025B989CF|nr:TlpA disulfide reductase family protein [Marinilabilia sp.]